MKSLIATICILGTVGLAIGVTVWAGDNFDVTCTITPVLVAINRTAGDGGIAYGNVGLSGTKNSGPGDLADVETYQNNGSAAELFRVKTSTATGGATPWTVGGTIDTDVFVHSFATTTGLTWQILNVADTYETASSSVAVDATVDFYFKIDTPSGTTVYAAKTITVNIQAIEAP